MGERAEDKRITELKNKGIELYSISKLDSINHCLYSSYITYRLDNRGGHNVYDMMGSKLHDVLEAIANGTATKEDLLPAMQSELEDLDMLGINFPSDKIRDSWIKDISHFCETFEFPKDRNFDTEQLFIYKTDDGHYIQGYIDLLEYNEDGTINIFDHKSSSMYNSKDMDEHARQLIIYMLGKQQEGFKVNKIAWHFMKYVNINYVDLKGNFKTKIVERRKVYEEMEKYVDAALTRARYDEFEADIYLMDLQQTNKFDGLPEEVKRYFSMTPAIIEYEVTQEIIDECKKYIKDTIALWESLENKDVSEYIPRKFYKVQKNGKTTPDVWFCTQLCSHFRDCPHIHEYLEEHPLPQKEGEV